MGKESSFKIFYHTLLPFVQIFLRVAPWFPHEGRPQVV